MYEYNAEVLRVVDGDTVDVLIDVGFSTFKKERVLTLYPCSLGNKNEIKLFFVSSTKSGF